MRVKRAIKRIIPNKILNKYQEYKAWKQLKAEALKQLKRYNNAFAKPGKRGKTQSEARVTFYGHQIEKGLSHGEFRMGFGKNALRNLSVSLAELKDEDPMYKENIVYMSALAALWEYRTRHEAAHFDIAEVISLFPKDIWDDAEKTNAHLGGSVVVTATSKENNAELPFGQLFSSRRSIREYSSQPVTQDEIQRVVELAMKTPSVCNRQSTRVYAITNEATIEKALKLQGGFNGYAMPPVLFLITADNSAFLWPNERNEGFTDGGLFSMSLLLSLEANGLAACPLNTMMSDDIDKKTKALVGVPDSEFLVMYIAAGHFAAESKTCISQRFPVDRILKIIK